MGYGFGGFLLVVGLILALAVDARVSGVDVQMVGWIMAIVGVLVILLSVVTMTSGRRARSTSTTIHPDGSQTVQERRSDLG